MRVDKTQTKSPMLKDKLSEIPEQDLGDLNFSALQPAKTGDVSDQEQKRSLPEKLARNVVDFERHPLKKIVGGAAPIIGIALSLNALLNKNSKMDKKLVGLALGLPLVVINLIYKEVINPAAKNFIPEKNSKTNFNPDTDMVFPSAEFKEILFNGISRFLDASDRSDIELKLASRKQKSPTMLGKYPIVYS